MDQEGNIWEDHFVFYSDDKKKDPWFVELCKKKIIEYYAAKGVNIDLDIEFTDGCGHQFKSKEAFRLFVDRSKRSIRVFCLAAVTLGDTVIRNCQELMEFSKEALTQVNRDFSLGPMENRLFYEITEEKFKSTGKTIQSRSTIHFLKL